MSLKKIIFLGGFEITKNSLVAHQMKDYMREINKPIIVLYKDECTNIMPSLSLHHKGVGLKRQDYLLMPEYLHLIQDKEYQQFMEIVKHIAEANGTNIIAVGRFVNIFSNEKWIKELKEYFSLLNYEIDFYFIERMDQSVFEKKNVKNTKARAYFERKVEILRKNTSIIKVRDKNFINTVIENIQKKLTN